MNDSFIALRAGARAPWGVVVIAGTGTVAAGRNRAGETFRTLGLGRLLGDEGSASDVGRGGPARGCAGVRRPRAGHLA